jgi:hypothetical protein
VGLTLFVVIACGGLLTIFWLLVLDGLAERRSEEAARQARRSSEEAAREFLDDLLVPERVPSAYRRCSEAFRRSNPEVILSRFSAKYPHEQVGDLTLVGSVLDVSLRKIQVSFSSTFGSRGQLLVFVNLSKKDGEWWVDSFVFRQP